jgi:hypothetical protein
LLHTALALVFTYGLARKLCISATGSALAALAFAFGGFHQIHLLAGNFLTFSAAVWLPLVWWSGHRLVTDWSRNRESRSRWISFLFFVLALSFQILSGHPQMVFYSLVFSSLWLLVLAWQSSGRCFIRWLRFVLVYAGAGLMAALLCAVQLLPTLEYIGWSTREEGLEWEEATQFSYSLSRFLTLGLPEFFGSNAAGDYWGYWKDWSSAYVGVWPVILAGAGIVFMIRRGRKNTENKSAEECKLFPLGACLLAGGIALFLSFGRHNPAYRWVLDLPGFSYFRAPSKFLPYFILPLVLLAGRGWDGLQEWIKNGGRERNKKLFLWFIALPVIFLTGGILAILLERVRFNPENCLRPIIESILTAMFIYAAGVFLLLILWWKGKRVNLFISVLFVLLTTGDLYYFAKDYFRFGDASASWSYWKEFLDTGEKPAGRLDPGRVLEPNQVLVFGQDTPGLYDPLSVAHYMKWMHVYEGREGEGFSDSIVPRRYLGPAPWLCALNRFIVYDSPQFNEKREVVQRLSQSLQTTSQVRVGGGVLRLEHWQESAARVIFYQAERVRRQPYPWLFDPSKELYIDESLYEKQPKSQTMPSIQAMRDYSIQPEWPPQPEMEVCRICPELWVIEFPSAVEEDGYLFISETWFPGWKYRLDNEEARPVIRAQYAFQAAFIPAETRRVEVVYEPWSYRIGAWMSFCAAGALAGLGGWIYLHKLGKSREESLSGVK